MSTLFYVAIWPQWVRENGLCDDGTQIYLSFQNDVELFYKFSPLLMQNVPKETVDAWISKGKDLDPKRLIPALVQYDHNKYRMQVMWHLFLVAIIGTMKLVPYPFEKSLQLIWLSGTAKFHLLVPDIQIRHRDDRVPGSLSMLLKSCKMWSFWIVTSADWLTEWVTYINCF